MATNKQKTQKVADNDAAALGYLRMRIPAIAVHQFR